MCEDAIKIRLPKEIKENMTYFEGNRNEDGNMNWDLADLLWRCMNKPMQILLLQKVMITMKYRKPKKA